MLETSDQLTPQPVLEQAEQGSSLGHDAWLRLRKNKMAMLGGIILVVLMVVSFLAPLIAPYSYESQNLNLYLVSPQAHHWFGTDTLGRDVLTRLLYGGRVSMSVGLAA